MTNLFENPPFTLSIVWHPDFLQGEEIAEHLYNHFRGDIYKGVARGTGIEVFFLSEPAAPGGVAPLRPELPEGSCHAVVVLVEDHLRAAFSGKWGAYLEDIIDRIEKTCEASLIFPVAFNKEALSAHPRLSATNFIRWYDWFGDGLRQLTAVLTHEFCRLLLPWVTAVEQGLPLPPQVEGTPEPVMVFISHSKQDGEPLAKQVRDIIHHSSLKSFFDAYDIPSGRSFAKEIKGRIKKSALLVVQTDSYASREWCRLEVLTARRHEVPVVVLNAIKEGEPRSFPYVGNVPVVMAGSLDEARISLALGRLLDEYLKSLYWRMHLAFFQGLLPGALLLPRAPDLLTLVASRVAESPTPTIIHPDPPLGNAERELLQEMVPKLRLETPTSLYVSTP